MISAASEALQAVAGRGERAIAVEMSSDEYHSERAHDSHSTIQLFRRSPAAYYETRVTGRIDGQDETKSMRLGTAAHMAICEPERFQELSLMIPADVLTSDGKRYGKKWDAFAAEHVGRLLLKQDEIDGAAWQATNVRKHPVAGPLLARSTDFEHSIFWTDDHGCNLKCRLDIAQELDGEITDLKTSAYYRHEFWRAIKAFSLHCQAAHYRQGAAAYYGSLPNFRYIVVRNVPPYEVYVVRLSAAALAAGDAANRKSLDELQACREGRREWCCDGYEEETEVDFQLPNSPAEPGTYTNEVRDEF